METFAVVVWQGARMNRMRSTLNELQDVYAFSLTLEAMEALRALRVMVLNDLHDLSQPFGLAAYEVAAG